MIDVNQTISVTELTEQIKNLLESKFESIWVSGEISNFKHHYSGHMYFTLKDDSAEIKVVMFKGFNQYLRFKPEDGMQVLANGRLSVYEQRGQYQLILKQLEPSGIGTLYLAFEALKKQLSEEGLFDSDRKKELPKYPNTIGVITSQSGAAVQDIFQILKRRAPFIKVVLRATKVQGEGAALDIVQAIEEFNEFKKVDVIILGRGGGSLEDLWPFNEEVVARAISASAIPIISAVGHETDYSISDMVADKRAPTPSTAAEIVSPSVTDIKENVDRFQMKLELNIKNLIERNWQNIDELINRHSRQQPQKIIELQHSELVKLSNRFINSILQNHKYWGMSLNPLTDKLSALSPKAVLERGYSVAFKLPDRQIIRASGDIDKGKEFELLTARGSFTAAKIKDLIKSKNKQ
ncbi:exodeoxyribonuclease VII large subunit [bacterium]|nr:exodeoxyribonuclease VII large subunit [bacterium]